MEFKEKIVRLLHWSQKYTQTDMVYLAKGSFWLVFGKASILLITLGVMAAFARWTSKETYGTYQYVISTIAILAVFALPGMSTALVRAAARGHDGMILSCTRERIKWGLVGAGISLTISLWYFFNQNFVLGTAFLIAGLFLPLYESFNLFQFFWLGKKRFDLQNTYLIISHLLAASVLISVIFLTNNVVILIFAYFASQTIFNGIFFVISLKSVTGTTEEKKTLSFGKHLSVAWSTIILGNQIDKVIIWQLLGPAAVAIYVFARHPTLRIQELTPISALALPKLSQKNVRDMEVKTGVLKKFFKLFLIFIPFTIFYILLAPHIYKVFFPGYPEAICYAQALALVLALFPFSLLLTSLVATMKTKDLYIIQFAPLVLRVILFLSLTPLYGIWGIIIAILIAEIFNSALIFYFFKKI